MKAARPSRTAHLVAMGRALADAGVSHVPNFHDPTARVFLDAKGKRSLANAERAAQAGKQSTRLEMGRGLGDMMSLRTLVIDAAVRDAIAGGVRQLVILGAGYDGRAWRMPELAGVKVFEVDHPATQGAKRAHLSELPVAKADITFVSMNFERDALGAVLERAGHDRTSPTCWLWEGVVMYLTREGMRRTLAAIATRGAAGSTLVVNYHALKRPFMQRLFFRLIGEPHLSVWTAEEMAGDLRAAGLVVKEDSGMADWNTRFAGGKARVDRASYMRIAVAQTRGMRP